MPLLVRVEYVRLAGERERTRGTWWGKALRASGLGWAPDVTGMKGWTGANGASSFLSRAVQSERYDEMVT